MRFDATTTAVKRLVVLGRARGYVSVDELNAALPGDVVALEMIEDVLAMLSDMGIEVVEGGGTEDGEATPRNPRGPLGPSPLSAGAEAPLGCFSDATSRPE